MPSSPLNHETGYSSDYIEACFFAWYKAGAPGLRSANGTVSVGGTRVIKSLPPNPDGGRPSIKTVHDWIERWGWRERADALDAQVSMKLDKEVIQERVRVLREIAKSGELLEQAGIKFITETQNPFSDNPSAAVRAIIAGAEMRFKYAGQADLLDIALMSDKQLDKEALRLLGKDNDDEIEATLEDIPSEDESTENDND